MQEPDNRFDKNAIAVYNSDTRIGYVPKKGPWQKIIREQGLMSCKLTAFNPNNPTYSMIVVEIEFKLDDPKPTSEDEVIEYDHPHFGQV